MASGGIGITILGNWMGMVCNNDGECIYLCAVRHGEVSEYRRVAQRKSTRLLTGRLVVRIHPCLPNKNSKEV